MRVQIDAAGVSSQIAELQELLNLGYSEAAQAVASNGTLNRESLPCWIYWNCEKDDHIYKPWAKGNWESTTAGAAIEDALNSTFTITSLDQNFRKQSDDLPEVHVNGEGDDITTTEPMSREGKWWERGPQSLTLQPSGDETVETVVLSPNGGPARSFVQTLPAQHWKAENVSALSPTFNDRRLGFRSRVDALFALVVVSTITTMTGNDEDISNDAIAATIRRHADEYVPLVGEGCFVSDFETAGVRKKLAGATTDQVRRFRERWAGLGVLS